VVISAFDGYLESEHARAGDVVLAGGVLARLDSRDLVLERARRLAERSEIALEHARALALGERAQANILLQQDAQVAGQIGLIDEQLARSTIRAPFDGIVVRGDLSQQVGGALRRGDELFTVAPLDSYRIILRVDETRVADVAAGQGGRLVLTALPNEVLPLTVERLTPVAEARDGTTSFRVEASVDAPSLRLRPGMEGIAKIDVGERHLIAIWTRSLVDWLTLAVWRYWP
jgi:RND family efflux transporter MFP subunit